MKYYIIAGEASGDLHASNLMAELKKTDPQAEFRCWGGDRMQSQGATLVKHIRDISFMGFTEVVANLRTIMKNISLCKSDLVQYRPDLLILVDYPGFNLRIAEYAKEKGLRVFYYISPQVWAWKQSRVKKIRRVVDRMYVILPFEKDFYARFGYEVDFVGHPLLDAIDQFRKGEGKHSFLNEIKTGERPLIALLPGSRRQEIRNMLKTMLSVVPSFPAYQFVIAASTDIPDSVYLETIGELPVKIVRGQTYGLLSNARAALVTSGTATLETALFNVPEAVCYKGSRISFEIAKRLVKIKYISLVNLILDKSAVREFIQKDLNTDHLREELSRLLDESAYRQQMLDDFRKLQEILGGPGASAITARMMTQRLQSS